MNRVTDSYSGCHSAMYVDLKPLHKKTALAPGDIIFVLCIRAGGATDFTIVPQGLFVLIQRSTLQHHVLHCLLILQVTQFT